MSMKNGVWHDALTDPPADGEQVLCVKETKKGVRSLCFGSRWSIRQQWADGWVTGGGCNHVIFWMPLPKVPQPGDVLRQKIERDELQSDFHDCVNELCLKCGSYREEHNGACDGCRWLKPRRGW